MILETIKCWSLPAQEVSPPSGPRTIGPYWCLAPASSLTYPFGDHVLSIDHVSLSDWGYMSG
jgi:hypothetical protein